jgi:hypothetical protein
MAEVARHVVRVIRTIEVCRMTLIAVYIHQLVVSVNMTGLALHSDMGPGQREPRCIMIERRVGPVRRGVTLGTIVVKVPGHMVRVRRLLELRRMALVAIRVLQLVIPVHVTLLTRR